MTPTKLPTPSPERVPHRRWRVLFGLIVVVSCLAGLVVIKLFPPNEYPIYPKCFLHETTGLHCPGCGLTRSLHSLVNLQFRQAIAYNPLLVFFGIYWGWLTLFNFYRRQRQKPMWSPPSWFNWLILAGVCAFSILRNIPVEPFTILAPHVLQ